MDNEDKAVLRARDFVSSLVLMAVSVFFLWRTSFITLWGQNRAGVRDLEWFSSAAIVPLGIFTALLLLSIALLVKSIQDGGAERALGAAGIGWNPVEARRFGTIAVILFFYIAALVPRVDFLISSALLISTLIHGFHGGHGRRMWLAAAVITAPGLYALIAHFPRAEWNAHSDDWVALTVYVLFTLYVIWRRRAEPLRVAIPVIAIVAPLLLILAMAYGFRQNVPARGGLIFKQIEYQYFVNIRPLWNS
ncbi:MAG: hypothetical protein AAF601_04755 [Pseudomonadota bacterium]